MKPEHLLIEDEGDIRLITINRPDKLNALNTAVIQELSEVLGAADKDGSVRVVILTGAGGKAFVAGADITEFAHFDKKEGRELSAQGHKILFDKVEEMGTPVIAAVNGFALGGGLELAMACHVRIASDNARMGLPEVSLGVIPGYGGTQRLTQLVGKGRALEMITTAGMIDAAEAYRIGLVNKHVPAEELLNACRETAKKMAKNSPQAIAAAIRAVNGLFAEGINGMDVEIEAFGSCFGSEDFKEGTSAFLEKRKPNFTGH